MIFSLLYKEFHWKTVFDNVTGFELFKLTDSRPLISRVNILKISGPAQHNYSLHSFCKGRGVQCYILQFTKLVKAGNTLITNDFL